MGKISDLVHKNIPADDDVVPVVNGGATHKAKLRNVFDNNVVTSIADNTITDDHISGLLPQKKLKTTIAFRTGLGDNLDIPNEVQQKVIFNNLDYNIGGAFDQATGVFTAPVDGVYMFIFKGRFATLSANNSQWLYLVYNSDGFVLARSYMRMPANGQGYIRTVQKPFLFTAGESLHFAVYHNYGSTAQLLGSAHPTNAYTMASGYLIGVV